MDSKTIKEEIQDLLRWFNAEGSGQCEHGFCGECGSSSIRKKKEIRLKELQDLLLK